MTYRLLRRRNQDQDFRYQLGVKLQELRHAAGLRLLDVHDRTGIGIELLSRAERGLSQFTILELLKLSVVYETTVPEILEDLWHLVDVSD